ncbi:M24 family metallopeptidase [Acidocella sp.]|uniref:M24 family metallopeptidase n=1 Tax=Acidocella sp. TaxID=50710 RepID=UPI002614253C|nr:M24 family metallopeptidase [Acidocella sp.]
MSDVLDKKQIVLEAVGPAFVQETMLEMRAKTRAAIHAIAANCHPGMVEEDAVQMARDLLAGEDMIRGWHDVYVRFGTNTLKTFGAESDPGIVLGETDIFFIDIGPVWGETEGDGGDTFTTGADAGMEKCAADAKALFHTVRKKWQGTGMSGKALYDYATEEAKALGWELNMDLSGHRISDFPHEAVYAGPLADVDFKPSPLLWVLEIHIRHPEGLYGAFFEDMLLDDSYFA